MRLTSLAHVSSARSSASSEAAEAGSPRGQRAAALLRSLGGLCGGPGEGPAADADGLAGGPMRRLLLLREGDRFWGVAVLLGVRFGFKGGLGKVPEAPLGDVRGWKLSTGVIPVRIVLV